VDSHDYRLERVVLNRCVLHCLRNCTTSCGYQSCSQ